MNKLAILAGAMAFAAITSASPVLAEERLVFANPSPQQMPLNADFLAPWVDAVNAEGAGVLHIDLRFGSPIVNDTNVPDRLLDDVVQIGMQVTVFSGNRFPRTLVATLPFLTESGEQASAALWDVYEKGGFDAELQDFVVLMFGQFPQTALHMNGHPVSALADIAGRQVVAGNASAVAVAQHLGATPLSFTIADQYQALQRGAAAGTMAPFTALPAFRLDEVTTDHLIVPLGGAPVITFMARERFEALSPEAQALLMRHGGRAGSIRLGQFLDRWDAGVIAMIAATPGHTVSRSTEAENAELAAFAAERIYPQWTSTVPDGQATLDMFRAALRD